MPVSRITFPVKGMTCAACQSAVERSLSHTDGVREASVNLMLHAATVTFDPAVVQLDGLLGAVRDIGYEAEAPAMRSGRRRRGRRSTSPPIPRSGSRPASPWRPGWPPWSSACP